VSIATTDALPEAPPVRKNGPGVFHWILPHTGFGLRTYVFPTSVKADHCSCIKQHDLNTCDDVSQEESPEVNLPEWCYEDLSEGFADFPPHRPVEPRQ